MLVASYSKENKGVASHSTCKINTTQNLLDQNWYMSLTLELLCTSHRTNF